ncbi:metallophosphoesterase family protein [Pontiella agarivorans]|uniref:Metallophosphoesterase family protein n=1 Tax=Pontiella agarivorans TaxID=3038953 RepID=A0ABU5MTY2_9BACT|nr:metallophosphoesterase family protein [Pontiella agarivorans]MDZ8117666.1 metallophosphoesterase family protein [Pontiella agarivorans]
MKYAILGDIHANLEALSAVLEDAEQQSVTHYACTGDVVGYNADPKSCLQMIRSLNCSVVQGNHDYYAACNENMELFTPMAQKSIRWTRKHLSPFERKYLRHLPLIIDIENFTIVHSSLSNPHRWNYIFKRRAADANFRNQFNNVCFFGHTHVPLAFVKGDAIEKGFYETLHVKPGFQYLINVGSVGQPRDRNPKAAYVIYDLDAQTITIRRVDYDLATTQKKIRAAGLPFRNALRLASGR